MTVARPAPDHAHAPPHAKTHATMNTSDFDTPSPHDDGDRFDARARQAHAAAQAALSPRVRAQLQQRRRAALAGRATRGVRWVPTLTMAATLALAVGLGLRLWSPAPMDEDTNAGPDATAGTAVGATVGTTPGGVSQPDTQGDLTAAMGAAGDGVGRATAADPAAADSAATARAPAATRGRLEADLDAIAALLAAPAAGAQDTADDASDMDTGQDDALLAALEESPDFYLWLGADDGAGVEAL